MQLSIRDGYSRINYWRLLPSGNDIPLENCPGPGLSIGTLKAQHGDWLNYSIERRNTAIPCAPSQTTVVYQGIWCSTAAIKAGQALTAQHNRDPANSKDRWPCSHRVMQGPFLLALTLTA
ncbi:hypothetical protein MAPG_02118 [Magnaporthiopsis poae ATCC 64411]|uniref:Uncharacterized protein n=1 Tax=Magnaporthiopsis poae (strain ATCC 64411 / 73-15) TaxID=644358 RepID=A0A0C4DQH6_MAGP6|nr:hypothetical protein MAPG_02118 [Magnaporthiopsis poae ATCC 64411]